MDCDDNVPVRGSLPLRERGLKYMRLYCFRSAGVSLPLRERGLKLEVVISGN